MLKLKYFGILVFALVTSFSFAQKSKNLRVKIKPNTVSCTGVADQECMQVKFCNEKEYSLFYQNIEGFTFEKGYEYKLKVKRTEVLNPPADGSKYKYTLRKVVSKKAVKQENMANYFNQKLFVTKLNGKAIDNKSLYLTIDKNANSIYGNSACNRFNISYNISKDILKTKSGMGTLMACDEKSMALESEFMNAIQDKKFKISQNGNKFYLTDQNSKNVIELTQPTESDIWSYIGIKKWKLVQLENVGMDYGKAFIQFDAINKRVNGNSGCNNFFGEFTTTGDNITFSKLGSTRMACLDEKKSNTERKVLDYLGKSTLRYDVADQTLNIYDGDKLVMIFAKQD